MNAFQLISDLYRILGDVDQQTLEAAQQIAGTRDIRAVIKAMSACVRRSPAHAAQAPKRADIRERGEYSRPEQMRPYRRPDSQLASPTSPAALDIEKMLVQMLSEGSVPMNARDLAASLKRAGLFVSARPKDGATRLLRRAAAKLSEMPEDRRAHTLSTLLESLGVDQTAGWMKVIRDSDTP